MSLYRAILYMFCAALVLPAGADVIVDYTVDMGGNNSEPLNGLAARGTFDISGTTLSIVLENTSLGVPDSFQSADALLVSLGMNLPDASIVSGNWAVIAPGSAGLGAWSGRGPGDSVGEEWIWTNGGGGDLLAPYAQIISTSSGHPGTLTRFDGGSGSVNGPYGGMAANPPLRPVPPNQPAVSSAIHFELTLSRALSADELAAVAHGSVVEYGSDQRYLGVPEPASLAMLLAGLLIRRR